MESLDILQELLIYLYDRGLRNRAPNTSFWGENEALYVAGLYAEENDFVIPQEIEWVCEYLEEPMAWYRIFFRDGLKPEMKAWLNAHPEIPQISSGDDKSLNKFVDFIVNGWSGPEIEKHDVLMEIVSALEECNVQESLKVRLMPIINSLEPKQE